MTPATTPTSKPGAPRRPKPADFREQFIRHGWEVTDHYRTSWKVIDRWVQQEGREGLRADRKAYRQMQVLAARLKAITAARSPVITTDLAASIGIAAYDSAAAESGTATW